MAEKKKRFEENPDSFVEISELIMAVRRMPQGIAHFIGKATRAELMVAKGEIQYQIDKILRQMEEKIEQGRIVVAKGGTNAKS
jgi:hypothetical protein